jgi:hypothetical protein
MDHVAEGGQALAKKNIPRKGWSSAGQIRNMPNSYWSHNGQIAGALSAVKRVVKRVVNQISRK